MGAYIIGLYLGVFIGGCIFGLFPLIVGIVKKRAGVGVLWMLLSGVCGLIHSLAAVAVAVIAGIVLLCQPKKTAEPVEVAAIPTPAEADETVAEDTL